MSSAMRMPALFLGHGSPTNALAKNLFTDTLEKLGKRLPRPQAVLMISAHWMTKGTYVTAMAKPKTIHDFYGFPRELFDVQYPAPGSPDLAEKICALIPDPPVSQDVDQWGLDHGAWAILKLLFPKADVPVVQLSLDMEKPGEFHLNLGKKLRPLRDQGVMIIGSGNIVHNLRTIRWEEDAAIFPWAIEFDEWVKEKIAGRDFEALARDALKSEAGKLSVPTWDHYYPLLTVLGATLPEDLFQFEFEGFQNASISMRCMSAGLA